MKTNWKELLSSKTGGFYFISELEENFNLFEEYIEKNSKDSVVKIIKGSQCKTKEALFKEFATVLEFPDYFGHNWDALDECIQDLAWLPAKKYVIFITDLDQIVIESVRDMHNLFLDILKDAVREWDTDNDYRPVKKATPLHIIVVNKPYTSSEEIEKRLQNEEIQYSFISYMRFFMSGEIYKTVGDKIRPVCNTINKQISEFLLDKNYGDGIQDWGYIIICNPPEILDGGFLKERKHFFKKNKDLDMRLQVDYDKMLKADEKEVFKLICNSILRSIDLAENELKVGRNPLKIKDFEFDAFRKDLTELFNDKGWL